MKRLWKAGTALLLAALLILSGCTARAPAPEESVSSAPEEEGAMPEPTMLPREEAGKLVDLGRLPAHLEGEEELMVRIVTVGDYDICPCIGEHVENTSEVGAFRLVSHDFTPPQGDEEAGRLRIRFKLKKNA